MKAGFSKKFTINICYICWFRELKAFLWLIGHKKQVHMNKYDFKLRNRWMKLYLFKNTDVNEGAGIRTHPDNYVTKYRNLPI